MAELDSDTGSDDGVADLSAWTTKSVQKNSNNADATIEAAQSDNEKSAQEVDDAVSSSPVRPQSEHHVDPDPGYALTSGDNSSVEDRSNSASPSASLSSSANDVRIIIPPYDADDLSEYDDFTGPERTVVHINEAVTRNSTQSYTVSLADGDVITVCFTLM